MKKVGCSLKDGIKSYSNKNINLKYRLSIILGIVLIFGIMTGNVTDIIGFPNALSLQEQLYHIFRWPSLTYHRKTESRLSLTKNSSDSQKNVGYYFYSTYQGPKEIIEGKHSSQVPANKIGVSDTLGGCLRSRLSQGSYIEIDIKNQMLLVYQDKKIVFDSPIISGLPEYATPKGGYDIISKHQGAYLSDRHPRYRRPYQLRVNYWLNLSQQKLGIHESTSHHYFGGHQFLRYGSLGCINLPPHKMAELFQIIEEGTLVIIH